MRNVILVILVIAAVLWAGGHVLDARASRNSPPAACQLLGGTWDLWNGWRCG